MRQRRWQALWIALALSLWTAGHTAAAPAETASGGPGPGAPAPWTVGPLLDVTYGIYGLEVAWEAGALGGRPLTVETAAGYSFSQEKASWQAKASLRTSPFSRWSISYRHWAGSPVLGREGEAGLALGWAGEQGLARRVELAVFHGRLDPASPEGSPEAVYAEAKVTDGWQAGPAQVGVTLDLTAGRVLPEGGEFSSSLLALPVQIGNWRLQPALGFSRGEAALAGYFFRVGGAGSRPALRGYPSGALQGDRVAALTVEYRRPLPWLAETGLPLLSQLEGVAFADAADTLAPGETARDLDFHLGYGAGLALSLGIFDLRWDLAWNREGGFYPEVYLQGAF
ncbi:MAG: BamA/TamA family outer membrane protein [Bacillota bacterium]|nr:BamA/TamA family outer membrane protein [Bacillota bacterium]